MIKTKEELNQLKTEYETLNNKLKELTDDEFAEVTGGSFISPLWEKIKDLGKKTKNIASTNTFIPPYPINQEPTDWKSNEPIPEKPGEYKL